MDNNSISSDLIRGHIDTIILYSLLENDKFAQQISDDIESKSDNKYEMKQATLYSSLKRLENLKYVSAYWHDTIGGRRRYFHITDNGKIFVEQNLSNWAFSRSIIDKLMNLDSSPLPYRTTLSNNITSNQPVNSSFVAENGKNIDNTVKEIVEKVDMPQVVVNETPATSYTSNVNNGFYTDKSQNNQINESNQQQFRKESQKEINFRNILNGLIEANKPKKPINNSENVIKVDLPTDENASEEQKVIKFNDSIDEKEHFKPKASNNGKIDFGDLTQKAEKEGYKVRISIKEPQFTSGAVFVNRVKICAALIVFLAVILEYLYFSLRYFSSLGVSTAAVVVSLAVLLLFPLAIILNYLNNPLKVSGKNINSSSIWTAIVITFNIIVIIFAADLLCGLDFSVKSNVLYFCEFPIVLCVDAVFYFVFKYLFYKSKQFRVK